MIRSLGPCIVMVLAPFWAVGVLAAADPLPSWRDGAVKERITTFVAAVTTPGAAGYVTPAERIAVLDDDGTLWPEKPRLQGMLALPRIRRMAPDHPEWRLLMPFRGALELGPKYLAEAGEADTVQLVATAFAGMTQDDFRAEVRNQLASLTHPRWNQPWTRLLYEPMRELTAFLRANGFRVFIVTAGHADIVRELAGELQGLPPDDVIGSGVVTTIRDEDGVPVIRRLKRVHLLNDRDAKALSLDQLGLRPLVAVGNVGSGGDVSLLRYSQAAPGRQSLQILIRHDDFEREYAYDEPGRESLNAAEKYGWIVVSMRFDWKRLFGFQTVPAPPTEVPVAVAP